ncbi:hypothetical protein F4823DRAFT_572068 [Ustulina deusta]|nr:hypothetical protein F4823DRAFT_572068 [Ustulina deusta]
MDIPGYYYDAAKRRYFKVENSRTAPTQAAWSSDSVKRRKLGDDDAATALQHVNLAKNRIRRARVLHEPLMGGFFAREYGAMEDDMQAACFVDGLRHKGCIPLLGPGVHGPAMQVKRMFIGGYDHRTGMCNVYAAPNEILFLSTYFPRDKNGRLNHRLLANYRIPRYHPPGLMENIPYISDIQYHAPSNSMFVTSRQPFFGGTANCLRAFSPAIDDDSMDPLRPRWLPPLEASRSLAVCRAKPNHNDYEAHCVAPAPAFSSVVCTVGTSRGIVKWDRNFVPSAFGTSPKQHHPGDLFHDVFAIDFHPSHGEVMRFGGRPGALFTADTRVSFTKWSYLKLPSTITHLRCLDGGNQVLVAGLQNQLGVYDMRFVRSHRGGGDKGDSIDIDDRNHPHYSRWRNFNHRNGNNSNNKRWGWREKTTEEGRHDGAHKSIAQPVIQFERYRNTAHIDIGFAYDAATGVVATAHDDVPGTIGLHSVRTGSRLRVLDLASKGPQNSRSHERSLSERDHADPAVVQSLQFQTFPGDHTPTLFVGSGPRCGITAFSFGVDDLEDEA